MAAPASKPPAGRRPGPTPTPRSRRLVKVALGVGGAAVVAFLIMQSVRDERAKPYTMDGALLRNWTVVVEHAEGPNDPVLVLRPPPGLIGGVFDQVFKRAMESLMSPTVAGIPLLLQGELERAFAGRLPPQAFVEVARRAGLESLALEPRCLGYRRLAEPVTRQLYFVLFEMPAFASFRAQVGAMAAGAPFDVEAMSPVLLIGTSGQAFDRWLPLRASPDTECVAPIAKS
jgi:hypothetical protein